MKKYIVILFQLLVPAMIFADSTNISAPALTYELRGNLREYAKVFAQEPRDVDLLQSQLKLELLSTLGRYAAFKAVNYCTYEAISKQFALDLKEAYVDFYSTYCDVRLGKQIISWGKADELNPTDVLNPQDLTILTEDKILRKTGLFECKADIKYKDFVLEGVWKPEFDYFKIPSPSSRWAFISLPSNVTTLHSPTRPEPNLENTEGAVKLSWTGPSIDASISYFYGWDNISTSSVSVNPLTHQSVLSSTFHRTKMIGADVAGDLFSIGLWGECAYFITEDEDGANPTIKNPYAQFTIGADYQFPFEFKVSLQYFQEIITKIDDDAEQTSEEAIMTKLGMGLPVQQAVSSRLAWKFGSSKTNSLELFGLFDIKTYGAMVNPKIVIVPEDAFTCELGVWLFDGDKGSIFERFDNNSEPYIKCTYAF